MLGPSHSVAGNGGTRRDAEADSHFLPQTTQTHSDPPLRLFIISSKKNKKINKINNAINKEETQ